jgi:phosphohistidine phosphatase
MKSLLLLRHAEYVSNFNFEDFTRPLSATGKGQAKDIGLYLRENEISIEYVLSSPATRANLTATLVAEELEASPYINVDSRIYGATLDNLLEVVKETEDRFETVLLVGHNPGLEELQWTLTGKNMRMQMATLICIKLNIDSWLNISRQSGTIRFERRPGQ